MCICMCVYAQLFVTNFTYMCIFFYLVCMHHILLPLFCLQCRCRCPQFVSVIFGKFGFVGSNHLALEHMPLVYVLSPGDCSGVSATDPFWLFNGFFFFFIPGSGAETLDRDCLSFSCVLYCHCGLLSSVLLPRYIFQKKQQQQH